jgi:hypothetical protein
MVDAVLGVELALQRDQRRRVAGQRATNPRGGAEVG